MPQKNSMILEAVAIFSDPEQKYIRGRLLSKKGYITLLFIQASKMVIATKHPFIG